MKGKKEIYGGDGNLRDALEAKKAEICTKGEVTQYVNMVLDSVLTEFRLVSKQSNDMAILLNALIDVLESKGIFTDEDLVSAQALRKAKGTIKVVESN